MKVMCLQAMAIVYGFYSEDIGPFADTLYIVAMLTHAQTKAERDRLLIFLEKVKNSTFNQSSELALYSFLFLFQLLLIGDNAKAFIDGGGVKLVVDFLTLSHLHVDRVVAPLQVCHLIILY